MTKLEIKKLDKLWSEKVKENANYKCEKCGKRSYLNSHHFYSRSNHSIRYNLSNGFCLCSGCHCLSSAFSAHKTPADFVDWAVQQRGEAWLERLRKMRNIIARKQDYEQIERELNGN